MKNQIPLILMFKHYPFSIRPECPFIEIAKINHWGYGSGIPFLLNPLLFYFLQLLMADIVDLQSYQTKMAEKKGFSPWQKRFGEAYTRKTTLSGISERTLYFLACPGEENAVAFYELIMGVLGMGEALKFYYLEQTKQLMVMDIHLFLADQVRFEMMRRLGWVNDFPGEKQSLFEMIQSFKKVKARTGRKPPELSESHPDFAAYEKVSGMDREVFIRRMFPKALEAFKKQIKW